MRVTNRPNTTNEATLTEATAVRAARTLQTQALANQDTELVASFWTEDVTICRALGQSVAGIEAARAVIDTEGDPATRIIYQRVAAEIEVSPHWPLAFEEGTWSGHSGSATGPEVVGGRYAAHWVKRDGRWLIRSEVFVALTCADAGCEFAALP